jgi:hypothetical protein
MRELAEAEIRGSFVNCSKGEARRLNLPANLPGVPWADLDFLGWRDPKAPERGYLVIELDRSLVGLALRQTPTAAGLRAGLCAICVTQQAGSGLALLAAPRPGAAGRQGNTAGTYMCADLACSLYVRGKKAPTTERRMAETIGVPERVERARRNAERFVAKVIDGG